MNEEKCNSTQQNFEGKIFQNTIVTRVFVFSLIFNGWRWQLTQFFS